MLDLILITVCYYAAYRLRFRVEDFGQFLPFVINSLPIVLGCKIVALYSSGLYQRSWDTFGLRDLTVVARGVTIGSLLSVAAAFYFYREVSDPNRLIGASRVVFVLDAILLAVAIIATRVSFRMMNSLPPPRTSAAAACWSTAPATSGECSSAKCVANTAWKMNPVAFIDDDAAKAHRWIVGVRVRGCIDNLEATMRQYGVDEVILSSRAINGNVETRIREICTRTNRTGSAGCIWRFSRMQKSEIRIAETGHNACFLHSAFCIRIRCDAPHRHRRSGVRVPRARRPALHARTRAGTARARGRPDVVALGGPADAVPAQIQRWPSGRIRRRTPDGRWWACRVRRPTRASTCSTLPPTPRHSGRPSPWC
jgi:hypothetical protein